jgi:hypothetical protein
MRLARLLLFSAALVAGAAGAQWAQWDADLDEEVKPWKEIEAKIPSYPRDGNLLQIDAGGASPHRFLVDSNSISIGEDGVVRYTLVVKTAGGATNVTFEGIRCDTREQKYYAVGHASAGWSRARKPQWRRIDYREVNRHHAVLFADLLCEGSGGYRRPYASVAEIVQRIRTGATAPTVQQ